LGTAHRLSCLFAFRQTPRWRNGRSADNWRGETNGGFTACVPGAILSRCGYRWCA